MDTHLIWNNIKIMFDAKNHDGVDKDGHNACLPNKDLVKFRENLRDSTDCNIGILFCLHTYKHPYKFWVETNITEENKLEIYFNKVMESGDPVEKLQLVAGALIVSWSEVLKRFQEMNKTITSDESKKWNDSAILIFRSNWTIISKLKKSWELRSNAIKEKIGEFDVEIDTVVSDMKRDIKTLNIDIQEDIPLAIPTTPAKKSNAKKGKSESST
jgi:hypothetical protein